MLTAERLREILHYDPETGVFTWRVKHGRGTSVRHPGDEFGTALCKGYRMGGLLGRQYSVHRLAFLYMTGEWPKADVDHVNRVRSDNRWANMREATRSQNLANRFRRGYAVTRDGTYQVMFRSRYVGTFKTAEAAQRAYDEVAAPLYEEFYNRD